jgi:hypothetical protein
MMATNREEMSGFSVKWRVAVLGKRRNSAAARREFSRHGDLSTQIRLTSYGRAQDGGRFPACSHRRSFPPCCRTSRSHIVCWCLLRDA